MKADYDWFLSKNPVGHLCRGGGVYGDVVVYAVWAGHGSVRDVHYPAGVDYFRGAAFTARHAAAAEAPLGANGGGDAGEYSGAVGRLDGHQSAASAKPETAVNDGEAASTGSVKIAESESSNTASKIAVNCSRSNMPTT